MRPLLVQDSRSFYHTIKQNRFYNLEADQEIIDILEEQLRERIKAANADVRVGDNRDSYMFFQGALMGATISAKQWKHHLEVLQAEQAEKHKREDN